MDGLLNRTVRAHILQGHSVRNTFLQNSLCSVKPSVLPILPPEKATVSPEGGGVRMSVPDGQGWLFVYHQLSNTRSSLCTHCSHALTVTHRCCHTCTWICGSFCERFLHFVLVFISIWLGGQASAVTQLMCLTRHLGSRPPRGSSTGSSPALRYPGPPSPRADPVQPRNGLILDLWFTCTKPRKMVVIS